MLGSSKIYNTPTNSEEICVPNFILWLSPPERVLLSLFNVKYPKPTSFKKFSLDKISVMILWEIFLSLKEILSELLLQ